MREVRGKRKRGRGLTTPHFGNVFLIKITWWLFPSLGVLYFFLYHYLFSLSLYLSTYIL